MTTNTKKSPEFTIILPRRGKRRVKDLENFATILLTINRKIGFKLSARGWCYQLEGFNTIDKGQFDRVQKLINECRKKGLLPIDFVAEDDTRKFHHIWYPLEATPTEMLHTYLSDISTAHEKHAADYWEGEEYYIQLIVEKVDLVSLFNPLCDRYFIPVANAKGWSSIIQRGKMIDRFKQMEENGHKCVLLYCGDHDPYGLAISDNLRKNIDDLSGATGWSSKDLIIDRFGLNHDFIVAHDLTWIDNLKTGSGKNPDFKDPIVKRYIENYGIRKVEANAMVIIPELARDLCENAILKYLGKEILERFYDKDEEIKKEYTRIIEGSGILEPLTKAKELLDNFGEQATEKGDKKFESRDSRTENPPRKPGDEYQLFPHLKIMLYGYRSFIVGELHDTIKDKLIGYAGDDQILYDTDGPDSKPIGKYNLNGECYLHYEYFHLLDEYKEEV